MCDSLLMAVGVLYVRIKAAQWILIVEFFIFIVIKFQQPTEKEEPQQFHQIHNPRTLDFEDTFEMQIQCVYKTQKFQNEQSNHFVSPYRLEIRMIVNICIFCLSSRSVSKIISKYRKNLPLKLVFVLCLVDECVYS